MLPCKTQKNDKDTNDSHSRRKSSGAFALNKSYDALINEEDENKCATKSSYDDNTAYSSLTAPSFCNHENSASSLSLTIENPLHASIIENDIQKSSINVKDRSSFTRSSTILSKNGEISRLMLEQLAKSCLQNYDDSNLYHHDNNVTDDDGYDDDDTRSLLSDINSNDIDDIFKSHGVAMSDIISSKNNNETNKSSLLSISSNSSIISTTTTAKTKYDILNSILSSKRKEDLLDIAVNLLLSNLANNNDDDDDDDDDDDESRESGITILSSKNISTTRNMNTQLLLSLLLTKYGCIDHQCDATITNNKCNHSIINNNDSNNNLELEHLYNHFQHNLQLWHIASLTLSFKFILKIIIFLILISSFVLLSMQQHQYKNYNQKIIPTYKDTISSLQEENIRLKIENEKLINKHIFQYYPSSDHVGDDDISTSSSITTSFGNKCWIQLNLGIKLGKCALDTTYNIKETMKRYNFWWNDSRSANDNSGSIKNNNGCLLDYNSIVENLYYTKEYIQKFTLSIPKQIKQSHSDDQIIKSKSRLPIQSHLLLQEQQKYITNTTTTSNLVNHSHNNTDNFDVSHSTTDDHIYETKCRYLEHVHEYNQCRYKEYMQTMKQFVKSFVF